MHERNEHGSGPIERGVVPSLAPAADLASAAARVGAYVWLSHRLFEVLGAWASSTDDPATIATFAGAARRFADQGRRWEERLPMLREADYDGLVRPAGPGAESVVASLVTLTDPSARLGSLREVLTALDDGFAAHLAACSEVRDATTALTLAWARSDLASLVDAVDERSNCVTVGTKQSAPPTREPRSPNVAVTADQLFT